MFSHLTPLLLKVLTLQFQLYTVPGLPSSSKQSHDNKVSNNPLPRMIQQFI